MERSPKRLPSLDLLKGFDAAARHLSFTRAADELFLTQSALSRQMQTLEEQVGVSLFERRHRELRLTDAGQVLQATAKAVLDDVGLAIAKIRREQSEQPLKLSTNQPFASLWLIPRLARFRERYPHVDVFISADNRIVDLDRERIDLAVRYCTDALAPAGSPRLFGERLVPVCSPALAADRARPLRRPQDLARHVLLHIDDERGRYPWLNWSVWFAAIGIHHLSPTGSIRFTHFDQVIQAALDGQGVALGRVPLIGALLQQRKLVAPFSEKYATTRSYFVVRGSDAAGRPEVEAFVEWLCQEAREEADLSQGGTKAAAPKRRTRK
jgi:LysR family transcriptional regulator, glycine cleavage system transcriptional activator